MFVLVHICYCLCRISATAIFLHYLELALANIPKVEEHRSISRSGLSVITLVFKKSADIYWARQQVNEMLKEAEEAIPKGDALVSLAPITTGLGEMSVGVI